MNRLYLIISFLVFITNPATAQSGGITGQVKNEREPVSGATVHLGGLNQGAVTDENGKYIFKNTPTGNYQIHITHAGFQDVKKKVNIGNEIIEVNFFLQPKSSELDEIVVTGTMKEIRRSNSPVPVEIITPKLFQKNPTPSLFEAVGMVNGVKPQLNCNF